MQYDSKNHEESDAKAEILIHNVDLNKYLELGWKLLSVHSIDTGAPAGVTRCTCGKDDCRSIGKHPLTLNGVKDASNDSAVVAEMFAGDYAIANVAVATGEVSKLLVLDEDELPPLTLPALEKAYGALPKTPTSRTGGGGRQFFFLCDERCIGIKNAVKFLGKLDVRTTGGYVIVPPSLHASGNRYEWIVSPWEVAFAPAPDWLLTLIREMQKTSPASSPAKRVTETVTTPVTISESSSILRPTRAKTLSERVSLYLEATPPAISGQSGHATTWNVVCRIVELFGELSDDEIIDAMSDWNNRCSPPWSVKELRHKLTDARKKVVTQLDVIGDEDEIVWPSLDAAAYYGLAGDIVRAIEPHSEADPVAMLVTLLTSFGCCIGRNPYYEVEGDTHHANLYLAVVGKSSKARKGTSFGRIWRIMRDVDDKFAERKFSGLSSGEGLINALRDVDDDKPAGTLIVPEKRALFIESELASVLKRMKRENNTMSAILRDAWDRGELRTLTKGDPLRASNVHVSIVAHVTHDELTKTLDDSEMTNGFANRFLWAMAKRSKELPDGGNPDDATLNTLKERLTEAIATAKTIGRMQRSPDCAIRWREVYSSLIAERVGRWDAATSRAESQTLRLSMVYALLDGSSTIHVHHLDAALAVWRYCDHSARCIFGESDLNTLERRLVDTVRQRPGILRSELRHSISHDTPTKKFDAAIRWLLDRGEIVCVPVYDGRQADCFYVGVGRRTEATPSTTTTTIPPTASVPMTPAIMLTPASSPTSSVPITTSMETTLNELMTWLETENVTPVKNDDGIIGLPSSIVAPQSVTDAIAENQLYLDVYFTLS